MQEDSMPVETPSLFSQVIQEHLELKRRNAALENHPLFKTEEQARIEDTMDGVKSIVDEPTSLEWPAEDTFIDAPVAPNGDHADPDQPSDENLWSRSRDFDWGD